MKGKFKNWYILLIVVGIIFIDQISKIIARSAIEFHSHINVLGEYLVLTKVENTGAFLGLGNSLSPLFFRLFMILIPLTLIVYAFYYLIKKNDLPTVVVVAISFFIGGGLGNIIDRIIFGSVTDFIYMDFILFHTGILNLADVFVTFGFFLILYELIFHKKELDEKEKGLKEQK